MSVYKSYSPDQIEELNSNFLIDSWSYSKVTQFSRNEKAFEKLYIYRERSKFSSTTIAGQAYHYALQWFFQKLKDGEELLLVDAQTLAFNYIDEIPANDWKIQKTTPTVEECQIKANKTATALLNNFYSEIKTYLDEIEEVLDVEVYFSEYMDINGVDIPIKGNGMIDITFRSKDSLIIHGDHKSKDKYTAEDEIKFSIGKQAISYYKGYESKKGIKVDEVWFFENKYSKNKDNTPQIQVTKIKLDENVIRLYEALLYEPLKRMIEAISNPDYVYLINDSDNYVDKAEIYDFWAKTLIAEVDEFNVPENKKPMIEKRLKKIRDVSIGTVNPKIIKEFRKNAKQFIQFDLSQTDMKQEEKIEHILRTFGVIVNVAHVLEGYSSNTYLLEVNAGVKIATVQSHKLDIANALDVANVRIPKDLKMYLGKSYLAVETSKKRDRDLLWEKSELVDMKLPIGKDNLGNTIIWNLENHSTPHVLVCGATGSGKSVMLFSTIEYALLLNQIDRIVVFDPKFEFLKYKNIKKVEVYNEILDIEEEMKKLVDEMNLRVKRGHNKKTLVIMDEFADAVSASRKGKELDIYEEVVVGYYKQSPEAQLAGLPAQEKKKREKVGELKTLEENLRILLQKGRSTGFRIISATQRASTKVITGDAKVNYPIQICFRVPKEIDSRVVIDEPGAESLGGMGDFLMKSPEYPDLVRGQAYYKPN